MHRSAGFVVVAGFSAIVMVLFANSSYAERNRNCEAKIVNNSYDCTFEDNDFPAFTDCFEFVTGGTSQNFDLLDVTFDYGCACDATGSSDSPSFNHSSSAFECTTSQAPFLFNGKIEGKKLSVQGIGSDGSQYVGTCTLRDSPCF